MAGAGSGKTRTLTRKIAWLIGQGVSPSKIAAMTFTNKAADEMRGRIAELCPDDAQLVQMGTFHSFGLKMLRRHPSELEDIVGISRNFSVLDAGESAAVLWKIRDRLIEDAKRDNDPARYDSAETDLSKGELAAAISNMRMNWVPEDLGFDFKPREAEESRPLEIGGRSLLEEVRELYLEELRETCCADFDSLAIWPVQLLFRDSFVREQERERLDWILVDEYQDVNQMQYLLMRGLMGSHTRVAVVGDPDQSIYGFRGSDVRRILEFDSDFGDCSDVAGTECVLLDENYRSFAPILEGANNLIRHNEERPEKDLRALRGDGKDIKVYQAYDEDEEAAFVAKTMTNLSAQGVPWSDMAVLYRINALSRTYENALLRYKIPYRVVAGTAFFERAEVKDVLAVLRPVVNPRDENAFSRAIRRMGKGFGDASCEKFLSWARRRDRSGENGGSFWSAVAQGTLVPENADGKPLFKGKTLEALRDFAGHLAALGALAPKGIEPCLSYVLNEMGFDELLRSDLNYTDRKRNVMELLSIVPGGTLEDALAEAMLQTDAGKDDGGPDRVSLMTVHASKGLEFPYVFITAFEQGMMPFYKAEGDPWALEEERRLCYVAMTRAENRLFVSMAENRRMFGKLERRYISQFAHEMSEPCPERRAKLLTESENGLSKDEPWTEPPF